jgi:hypothetical protein
MKALKQYIPEIYFVIAILYYWSLTAAAVNWIAIIGLIVILFLIVTKNKITGIITSSLIIAANLFLFLALFSELSEFTSFNSDAKKLLFIGALFLGLNLLVSVLMLLKYAGIKNKNQLVNSETS